ncbi:hypothetical protein B0T20DRAFT_113265 [Sordaria brevicollis]|uniref:Uncharacterized protein n=1 Tax=Sordaria brevicollis TaxID=83679 RepID=A0AAE0PK32_SORBR|nr:hypothetical protein B0T20DRAFT_113265 [Sordaria brevicollis]
MAPGTFSRFFREVMGQNSYQSEYYVVRQPSHRRRARARSVERTSKDSRESRESRESRPRREHHVHETVEIHRKPSRRHGDREKKVRKEYEYRYELFQDDSEPEDNADLKHVSWAQWPDLQATLSNYQSAPQYQYHSTTEPSSEFQPQTDNQVLQEWISTELALIWSSLDQLHRENIERSANYDPYLQQAILASYATFKEEQIQPLLDEIARLERQGKDYEDLVKELMGVIRGYQVELRAVWDREEKDKKEQEERAAKVARENRRRREEETARLEREWEAWHHQNLSGPALAGGSGSNPPSPTGSAPPPYEDGHIPPEQQQPAPAPQHAVPVPVPVGAVPARPPKELEQPHQPRVRFEEILQEIPAPRHYTDDEYEYGPRDHGRRERGRGRDRDYHRGEHRENEWTYDWPRSPRTASTETQYPRSRDVHHNHSHSEDRRGRRHEDGRELHDRHHRHYHHRRDHHDRRDDRAERRADERLTDWNIPSPSVVSTPAPSTHWDVHPRSPRYGYEFEAADHRVRAEPRPKRRHSVSYAPASYAPSSYVSHVEPHWLPAGIPTSGEGDKYPRGWRVVRFAV